MRSIYELGRWGRRREEKTEEVKHKAGWDVRKR